MSIFSHYKSRYETTQQEAFSIEEYLEICKNDPTVYATAAERMLIAIGEPELIDTPRDPRLNRILSNKVIKRYPEFDEFYDMEECVEQIVSFFKHAAQGLEEKKQILYLLGPVGGGKSSLAEKLKYLMEKVPFCHIMGSPVFESPLGLFNPTEDGDILEEESGIPDRYLGTIRPPWAVKRLHAFGGEISRFQMAKSHPSSPHQIMKSGQDPLFPEYADKAECVEYKDAAQWLVGNMPGGPGGEWPILPGGEIQVPTEDPFPQPNFAGARVLESVQPRRKRLYQQEQHPRHHQDSREFQTQDLPGLHGPDPSGYGHVHGPP